MKVKCVNDCCGDFWDITVGKEYEVIEHIPEHLMYVSRNAKVTEERYKVRGDNGCEHSYPVTCFEIVS
ncbi:hypothetical protein G9F71_008960 [Clostridium sp. FP2]|uniref:hypothetical protein n=1 Tax=Clostridium sp. FP2 TaxID=2724481 RepID=UPI0013E90C78|nr:hypothetical protein [Clostridium sp. FP2]MBZ9622984.1 hypothetical protein [Clostridium sp. FP2]